ncbi:MAG: alcohol dehydrogenase catalytic domain-containing protein [bacterium]|jgi:threonine 3-dehydrogenase
MKAIAKTEPKKGFSIIDIEEYEDIQDNEVIVEIDRVSICGTDLHIYNWDSWASSRIVIPRVIGHEGCGKIVKLGKNVKNFNLNDKVAFESHIYCNECYQCNTNKRHICNNLKVLGIDINGLFSKYVKLDYKILWKLSDNLKLNRYAPILEPLGNAVHTISKVDVSSKYIAIFGDGPIALFLLQLTKIFGASKIFLIGISDYRLNIAKKLANNYSNVYILNDNEINIINFIDKETKGRRIDIAFEMSGSEIAIKKAIEILTYGGNFVSFGILSNPINFDYNEIIFKAIDIISINGRLIFETWFKLQDLIENNLLNVDDIITHEFNLSEYEKAFDILTKKQGLKIVLYNDF